MTIRSTGRWAYFPVVGQQLGLTTSSVPQSYRCGCETRPLWLTDQQGGQVGQGDVMALQRRHNWQILGPHQIFIEIRDWSFKSWEWDFPGINIPVAFAKFNFITSSWICVWQTVQIRMWELFEARNLCHWERALSCNVGGRMQWKVQIRGCCNFILWPRYF